MTINTQVWLCGGQQPHPCPPGGVHYRQPQCQQILQLSFWTQLTLHPDPVPLKSSTFFCPTWQWSSLKWVVVGNSLKLVLESLIIETLTESIWYFHWIILFCSLFVTFFFTFSHFVQNSSIMYHLTITYQSNICLTNFWKKKCEDY